MELRGVGQLPRFFRIESRTQWDDENSKMTPYKGVGLPLSLKISTPLTFPFKTADRFCDADHPFA
jgi:hypothetical protein